MQQSSSGLSARVRRRAAAYRNGSDLPLAGYLRAMAAYGLLVVGAGTAVTLSGRRLPERVAPYDVVLLGVATHKTARMLTKESVTSPLRAPFTRFEGPAGPNELREDVVAEGHAHAVGELLTCPFCMAQWVATAYTAGLLLAPRATRVVLAAMSARALSDALQLGYAVAERKATGSR